LTYTISKIATFSGVKPHYTWAKASSKMHSNNKKGFEGIATSLNRLPQVADETPCYLSPPNTPPYTKSNVSKICKEDGDKHYQSETASHALVNVPDQPCGRIPNSTSKEAKLHKMDLR
jgi:hypothetical protein